MAENSFLNPQEVKQLRAMYTDWLKKLKPEEFMEMLYNDLLVSDYEHEKVSSLRTSQEKNSHIFHNVLMKATYKDIGGIRDVLLKSNHAGHKALAHSLPCRESSFDYDKFDYPMNDAVPMTGKSTQSWKNGPSDKRQNPPSEQSEDFEMIDEEAERDLLDLEGGDCEEGPSRTLSHADTNYAASKASRGTNKVGLGNGTVGKSTPNARPVAKSAARPDYSEYQPQLKCYSVKPGNDAKRGKGLCAIIRNFSAELTGYEADARAIKDFFGNQLQYEVVAEGHGCVDMTKQGFIRTLMMLQGQLFNNYDRFFLFILSHGDEKGIKTCSPTNPKMEEIDENGQPVRIPVDEIVDYFTHDKVPSLKSFPKCFFIQACQGDRVAAPAAHSDGIAIPEDNTWSPPSHKITNKADVVVCLPSQKGTYSWVPSTGSWFIQESIAIFNRYHKQEHLVDMMVDVNNALSRREGKGKIGSRGNIIDVYQMPGLTCSLTQKFFLSIPPIAPYSDAPK